MTDNKTPKAPREDSLPKFSVNVAPTNKITTADLGTLLERFRAGDAEPLIFGDGNVPEAAVIPFPDFVDLLRRVHADESAFQTELSRRIRAADASEEPGLTLEELGDELGEPARSMIRKALDDD
ncbi:hypothetical protein ACFVVC_02240 [Pseudarthrobacter sp. NPDC058196]|uniref:hypothetical protein n=1 Tax=Pseudarthrobacter sp. NPDC058196 TaxID=3346376 RepID=UPI0036DDC6A8